MTEPRTIAEHGSRIIAALERAWAAIQDQHPDVPDVVIVTGAGSNQKGTPEGYRLRGHHWPERWVLKAGTGNGTPELFIAGELLSAGGRAVAGGHAARGRPRPGHPARHQGHQRRRATATTTSGSSPWRPSWACAAPTCRTRSPAGRTAPSPARPPTTSYADVVAAIDTRPAPVPGRPGQPGRPRRGGGGEDQGDDGPGTPAKRGGRRVAAECACQPEPRRIQLTPKQIEDGPIICGLCCAPFELPVSRDNEDCSTQVSDLRLGIFFVNPWWPRCPFCLFPAVATGCLLSMKIAQSGLLRPV